MKKTLVIIFICLLVVGAAYLIFGSKKPTPPAGSGYSRTSISVVKRGDLLVTVSSTGVIEPILAVDLKSKASGEIIELPIEEGDRVTKGQLIARLDASTARNDFEQKSADLEVARVALSQAIKQAERQNQLFEQGLISELDYENAVLAKEQANSNLIRAETALEDSRERLAETTIRSPIDGIVLKKYVEIGQIIASGISAVSGGTTIATVADMSKVYVRTAVDEVDIGQIKVGMAATVVPESYPDRRFRGKVIRIVPLAKSEQNVTTFDVTILVDNGDGLLMAGMNSSVEIFAGYKENILLVPREALLDPAAATLFAAVSRADSGAARQKSADNPGNARRRSGSQTADTRGDRRMTVENSDSNGLQKMVIIQKNGRQIPSPVEIGLSNFEFAEAVSGVAEGDTILITVTSKALKDREAFMQRMREMNQVMGVERRR